MSCMWCSHFQFDEDKSKDRAEGWHYLNREGKCRLEPSWQKVRGSHVCSKFSWQLFGSKLTPIACVWLDRAGDKENLIAARKEIRRLKAKIAEMKNKLQETADS